MKTPLQTFLELTSEKISSIDCQLIEKIKELMATEKECVAGAYEAGLIAAQKKLNIDATEYFNRFYSDPNEDTYARVDMQLSLDSGQLKKRKRKRIS